MRKIVLGITATLALSGVARAAAVGDTVTFRALTEQGQKAYRRGAFAQAEADFKQALRAADGLGGSQTQMAKGITYTNLGATYLAQDKLSEAEEAYKQSVSIKEGTYGKNHPLVADSLSHYAACLRRQKRSQEAEQTQVRAEMIQIASAPGGSTPEPQPQNPAVPASTNPLAPAMEAPSSFTDTSQTPLRARINKLIFQSERDKEKLWNPDSLESASYKGSKLTGARISGGDAPLDFINDFRYLEVRYRIPPSVAERALKAVYEGGCLVELDNDWLLMSSRELKARSWHHGMQVELTARYVNGESIYTVHNGQSEFVATVIAERH